MTLKNAGWTPICAVCSAYNRLLAAVLWFSFGEYVMALGKYDAVVHN